MGKNIYTRRKKNNSYSVPQPNSNQNAFKFKYVLKRQTDTVIVTVLRVWPRFESIGCHADKQPIAERYISDIDTQSHIWHCVGTSGNSI